MRLKFDKLDVNFDVWKKEIYGEFKEDMELKTEGNEKKIKDLFKKTNFEA